MTDQHSTDGSATADALLDRFDGDAAGARVVLATGGRGLGKTWWLDTTAAAAERRRWRVLRATARPGSGAFGVIADLLDLGESADLDLASARQRFAALLDRGRLCLAIDDSQHMDASSRDVVRALLVDAVADEVLVLATAASPLPLGDADLVVELGPFEVDALTRILCRRGVAAEVAASCAVAASGNPGIAVAIADGLTAAQRSGQAALGHLPQLGGELAAQLQERMRALGEGCCRALVVAAAADDGDLRAVARALELLGEPGLDALEPAEELGVLELTSVRVVFPDPFARHAAFHLLAPASRRAAHRALAAAFDQPHHAPSRVHHLVGAARGTDDALAESLGLLAADAVRRGGTGSAVAMYDQAIELAASTSVRERLQVASLWATLDDGDLERAARLVDTTVATGQDLQICLAEARWALTGHATALAAIDPADQPVAAPPAVALRHAARRAAFAGEHRKALNLLEGVPRSALDLPVRALALRHAGRSIEARSVLADALGAALGRGRAQQWHLTAWLAVLDADLEVLAGRPEAAERLGDELAASSVDHVGAAVAWVRARAHLATDPSLPLADGAVALAWDDVGSGGAVSEVRAAVRAAVLVGDPAVLQPAIDIALEADLPIELGEARLWAATLHRRLGDLASATEWARRADATLQRCGVRIWSTRCAALVAPDADGGERVAAPLAGLSQAEMRVAEAVAGGLTNREVASSLFLSVKTVDFHLQQIYRKLGLRSRTELAVKLAAGARTVGPGAR